MNVLRIACFAVACACASAGALAQSAVADPLPVYDATQVALDRYTVIRRLWVEPWKSALWIPHHRDEAGARRALLSEAARLGADAVVNLYCLSQTDALFNPSGYYCYGNAIKIKK